METDALLARWRRTGLPTSTRGAAAASPEREVARLGAVQGQEFENGCSTPRGWRARPLACRLVS